MKPQHKSKFVKAKTKSAVGKKQHAVHAEHKRERSACKRWMDTFNSEDDFVLPQEYYHWSHEVGNN